MASSTSLIGTAQTVVLLTIAAHSVAAMYPPRGEATWINCTSRTGCNCQRSADCYDNGPGVCMRLMLGGHMCRYCPLGTSLLYHLPDIALPEGIPFSKVCQTMKICDKTRCFGDRIQCRNIMPSMNTRPESQCVCERGYKPERLALGVERCVDVDECAFLNRSGLFRGPSGFGNMLPPSHQGSQLHEYCPPNSRCENTEGSFQCICDEGYRDRYEKMTNILNCDDINECEQLGFGACSWYLACVNEPGTYRCDNLLHEWMSNEIFLLIGAAIVLFVLNILLCWMCSVSRRCLGCQNELPVRKRQKQLDKYSVSRL